MKASFVLAAVAAVLIGTAANAAEDSKQKDPNRKICRTISETGSRLNRTRACHTQAEWDELRRQSKAKLEQLQNSRPWNSEPGG